MRIPLTIGLLCALAMTPVAAATAPAPALAATTQDGFAAYRRGDYAAAVRLLRPVAEAGDVRAQLNLAELYNNGLGVPQDRKEAAKWYGLAAAKDNVFAQVELGILYDYGHGVPKDLKQAAAWYAKSADHGNPVAQLNLGLLALQGLGVPKDAKE